MLAGLFLIFVATPLIFTPFTAHPFADPKLVVFVGGVFLVASARPDLDRTILTAALIWVGVLTASATLGTDPLWSLLGSPTASTGLVFLSACASLLCVAVPTETRDRIPHWLFLAGVAVATLTVVGRFIDLGGPAWVLGRYSSTIGDRIFIGGFLAAPIVAVTRSRLTGKRIAGLVIIASGFSVAAVRSAWIGAAVGLAYVAIRSREDRRRAAVVLVVVGVVLVGWTVGSRNLERSATEFPVSAASRFTELTEGSAAERVPVWRANIRSVSEHPILGSGPSAGWGAFLRNATEAEIRASHRGYADAHNFGIELLTTTGIAGALAAAAVGALAVRRMLLAKADAAWSGGVALSVGAVLAVQPINITLTGLLFGSLMLASPAGHRPRVRAKRWLPSFVALLLLASMSRFLSSTWERYGTTYGSEAALRAALRFEPRRAGSTLELAELLAFESRGGDSAKAREAQILVTRAVQQHAWHPSIRLDVADIERLLDNDRAARRWIDEHMRLFPNDPLGTATAAALSLLEGDRDTARSLARRTLELDPDSPHAQIVLDRLDASD